MGSASRSPSLGHDKLWQRVQVLFVILGQDDGISAVLVGDQLPRFDGLVEFCPSEWTIRTRNVRNPEGEWFVHVILRAFVTNR
jgi:hypothetical protein